MTRRCLLAASVIVLLSLMIIPEGTVQAQTHSSSDAQQRDAALESVRAFIIQTIGAQDDTIEVSITGNILTVSRINSSMNQTNHGVRNNEASTIAPIVSKVIAGKTKFKNIHTIRVQYGIRSELGAKEKIIDTVDFRKDPSGTFQPHTT